MANNPPAAKNSCNDRARNRRLCKLRPLFPREISYAYAIFPSVAYIKKVCALSHYKVSDLLAKELHTKKVSIHWHRADSRISPMRGREVFRNTHGQQSCPPMPRGQDPTLQAKEREGFCKAQFDIPMNRSAFRAN